MACTQRSGVCQAPFLLDAAMDLRTNFGAISDSERDGSDTDAPLAEWPRWLLESVLQNSAL